VADLVALKDSDGNPHTGVLFPEDWCDHKALHTIPPPGSSGNVTGVAPLIDADLGALVYAGGGRTVHELAAILRDEEEDFGLKGTLELAIELVKIVQAAHKAGLGPHRGMTPWRILVAPNGSVSILGWGLRQLDLEDFLEDEEAEPSPDSLRYCPPERMEDAEEDESTDRYTALLIAIEVWLGEPIYNGVFKSILPQIEAGKAGQLLPEMPESADLAFATALGSYPEDRHDSAKACLSDLQAALADATGPSLAELVNMADGFASPREISLSATWQWPDGEPEGAEDNASAPAAKSVSKTKSVPDEVRPWLDAANEAADRAEQAAERAGKAADEATDQALRSAEGVEPALDTADEAADTALDEAERARNAATACESATTEATATTHAETAKQAASQAEDAASDARAAADKALDCSKAHILAQRKARDERLEALQTLVDEWETPAAPSVQFSDTTGVQQATAAAQEVLERIEAAEQEAEEALREAKTCDSAEDAATHIETFDKANGLRADERVALNGAYERMREADREAGKGFLDEAAQQVEAFEVALNEHLQAGQSTTTIPESLASKYAAQIDAEKSAQSSLKTAHEALADKRTDDALRELGEANTHLSEASAARGTFEEALATWNAHQLEMLEEKANTCREQFNNWDALPGAPEAAPEVLAEAHAAACTALQTLQETVEQTRAALNTLCAQDLAPEDRLEAAKRFDGLAQRHETQTQHWAQACEALAIARTALAERAVFETLRAELCDQLTAAVQAAEERLAKVPAVVIADDAAPTVQTCSAQLEQAIADARSAVERANETAQEIESASGDALTQYQESVPALCTHVTEAATAAQAAEQRLQSAVNEAAEESARHQEALQQQITALAGAAQQVEATRQSTFEAARATTRPAGPKMAMAWDAVEEVNETIVETLAKITAALEVAGADELETAVDTAKHQLDNVSAMMDQLTERVTALEDAARSALEEAERVGAARQAAEALSIENQGLQAPESVAADDLEAHADVAAALEVFAAASQALEAGRQAAQDAIQAVSEVIDAQEAEARLTTARNQVGEARGLTDIAREAAQALAQSIDEARAQQRQIEASRGRLAETQERVESLLERLNVELDIEPWSSLTEALEDYTSTNTGTRETLEELGQEIDTLLQQEAVGGDPISELSEKIGQCEDAVRVSEERRVRLKEQDTACRERRLALSADVVQAIEQLATTGSELDARRTTWQEHFGDVESPTEQATTLRQQLDDAGEQLSSLQEALTNLAQSASDTTTLDILSETLSTLEAQAKSLALPDADNIAAEAASAQHKQLVEVVEAAVDEAIAQVPPFDALDIMVGEVSAEHVTPETLASLHAARDAARSAGQAVTQFEVPSDPAELLEAPAALQALTAQCLAVFQTATDACAAAREESEARAHRATVVEQGLDAILIASMWDATLDQVAEEALTHLPDHVATLQATLSDTRDAYDVVGCARDSLPQSLEAREAFLLEAQSAAEVYQQGLATLQEALSTIAAAKQAAQDAHAADSASLSSAVAAFDDVFSAWDAPEQPTANQDLPEGVSLAWTAWCDAHRTAHRARELAQQLSDMRATGESSESVHEAIEALQTSHAPARDARISMLAIFADAAESVSVQARTVVLPDVMPLLEDASEALQAATAEMTSHRAAADAARAALEHTIAELRTAPTPTLWTNLEQSTSDLTAAGERLKSAKENVDKAFREGASPTQRLQRRQMRLERLRIQREEERQVASVVETETSQPSAPEATEVDEETAQSDSEPSLDGRSRRRRRPTGDEVATPDDGMQRRRRRRREPDEASASAGEPRRRRRRNEGEPAAAPTSEGTVDRSSRMERLRARRARQRDVEANIEEGAESTPAIAESPRRRRRRRPEGDEAAATDATPQRQRRRRRRETDDKTATTADSQDNPPNPEDP
jgi:hypothetical protein